MHCLFCTFDLIPFLHHKLLKVSDAPTTLLVVTIYYQVLMLVCLPFVLKIFSIQKFENFHEYLFDSEKISTRHGAIHMARQKRKSEGIEFPDTFIEQFTNANLLYHLLNLNISSIHRYIYSISSFKLYYIDLRIKPSYILFKSTVSVSASLAPRTLPGTAINCAAGEVTDLPVSLYLKKNISS